MINRRSFLRLVRNRVAAGVLCSGMLTDALSGRSTLRYIGSETGTWSNIVQPDSGLTAISLQKAYNELLESGQIWRSQYMNDPTKMDKNEL